MDKVEGTTQLINEELDVNCGHVLLVLGEVSTKSVHRVRNELEDQIEIELVFVAVGIEAVFHLDDVSVAEHSHYLQLSVLESFVLQNFLDGDNLSCLHHFCEEHDAKRAIADDTFSTVTDGFVLT